MNEYASLILGVIDTSSENAPSAQSQEQPQGNPNQNYPLGAGHQTQSDSQPKTEIENYQQDT